MHDRREVDHLRPDHDRGPLFLTPEDVDAYGPDDLDLNDTDPDGDDLVAELVDQAQHGTATVYPNGTYRYQGDSDYSSLADGGQPVTDSFTYSA